MKLKEESKANNAIFDKEIGARLRKFRELYIDKSQRNAAPKMGVTQSWLSHMEAGNKPVNFRVVSFLIKEFQLNAEWLATGKGERKLAHNAKPTAAASLQTVHDNVSVIMQSFKITEANITHVFKIIENQQKQIDALTDRLNQSNR